MVLVVLPNETPITRFAFSAGRSLGGAVLRNRAKRLMRAALQPLLQQINPGWDTVLIARQTIKQADYGAVYDAVTVLLRRAGILRENYESES
jgi:ribonuclease P protein component